MYNPYGFHSMSKQYREEALLDARTRHLEGWLRADHRASPLRSRVGLAFGYVPTARLRGRGPLAGQAE
jgi:hypothetical protein